MYKFKHKNPLTEDIEKHETLNPKLFGDDDKLKPEVVDKINEIVNEFVKGLDKDEIKFKIKDVLIIGSSASYNYTKHSDVDLHVIADTKSLKCPDNLYPKLYSAYRSLFDKKFDIEFYGIPVELYVETEDTATISNGIYSVKKNNWAKKPVAEDIPDVDKDELKAMVAQWEDRYKKLAENAKTEIKDEQENSQQIDKINDFIEDIYKLRKESLQQGGEYSIGNLVFKTLRNKGYLDKLKELKNQLRSNELSLIEPKNESLFMPKHLYEGRRISNLTQKAEISKYIIAKLERDNLVYLGASNKLSEAYEFAKQNNGQIIKNNNAITERLMPQEFDDYRNKLMRDLRTSVTLDANGNFWIHLVKEQDVSRLLNQIKNLDYVESATSFPSGKYDFSNHIPMPGKMPARYYSIRGRIKEN